MKKLILLLLLVNVACDSPPPPPMAAQLIKDCALYGAASIQYHNYGTSYGVECKWMNEGNIK